ncbi:MAG: iron-containing alcohol dehydrogenase [Kiritimatiellia bacterium]|jgi:alcohol dehydrogenase YqhD (iron-dependent ADH family)|nr:iron-containing alcohol dehydrogenase [Kiritimatiellia bacterium]
MFPFTYRNPTQITFGNGSRKQTGAELAAAGMRRVLLVYGQGSIRRNGVYADVTGSLAGAGIAWTEWPGVSPNPLLSHVREGIALARQARVDGVLAVGGGSVIDAAKAIALGVPAAEEVWSFYMGEAAPQTALPLATVLTLPATGSEMNGGTVITHDGTREKRAVIHPLLHPKVSLLDPETTLTVPPDYVAYSASDAISHSLESYLTRAAAFLPVQDGYAEGIIRAIMAATGRILEAPGDLEARGAMMWAATLSWNFLGSCGIGPWGTPAHMLEHPLSGLHQIAHGAGLAVTGPAWMTWERRRRTDRLAAFARRIMEVRDPDEATAAAEGIDRFRNWLGQIGNPVTLRDCGIGVADLPELARHAETLGRAWGCGPEYTASTCEEILRLAL